MKKRIGTVLMSVAFIDFLVSWFGIDFYGLFGISLSGFLYDYSPVIVGGIGFLLFKTEEMEEGLDNILDDEGEKLLMQATVSVRNSLTNIETGKFYITNKKIGYFGSYVTKGEDASDANGENNFSCSVQDITSVNSTTTKVNINYDDKDFTFMPGLTKVKSTVNTINDLISLN
jgi:hypothetical protein